MNFKNKKLLYFVGGFVLPTLVFLIIALPLLSKKSYYNRKLKYKEKELSQLIQLARQYKYYKSLVGEVKKPKTSGSIIAYLSRTARRLGLENNVVAIKPFRTDKLHMFEIRLDNLNLSEAVDFLFSLEKKSRIPLKVRRLQLRKKVADPQHLEMRIQIEVQ